MSGSRFSSPPYYAYKYIYSKWHSTKRGFKVINLGRQQKSSLEWSCCHFLSHHEMQIWNAYLRGKYIQPKSIYTTCVHKVVYITCDFSFMSTFCIKGLSSIQPYLYAVRQFSRSQKYFRWFGNPIHRVCRGVALKKSEVKGSELTANIHLCSKDVTLFCCLHN